MPVDSIKSAQASSRISAQVAPVSRQAKSTKTQTRAIGGDGTDRALSIMVTDKVYQNATNTATTPEPSFEGDEFSVDAYRNGGIDENGTRINDKYAVSDYERDEEAARISLVVEDEGNLINAYNRFFLQAVSEAESEKYQVVETFSKFYSFFYGRKPAVYRYAGIVIDDLNFRWANELRFMYDNFFRGTAASEVNATCLIQYSGRSVTGMVLGLSFNQQALDPKIVNFTLDVLVLDYKTTAFSSDVSALLTQKQQEITQLRASIEAQVAEINKNIPTEQRLTAGKVFSGKKPASSSKKKTDSAKKEEPESLSNAVLKNVRQSVR